MSVELLREYVRQVMVEKIRTRKSGSIQFGPKFDFKQFKALEYPKHLNLYAETYLDKIGAGSSRIAYILSSRYVLKIAKNNKGISQNEAEVAAFTNPDTKPIIAGIKEFDPDYKWIVSELVKPLTSDQEFENLTGISFDQFTSEILLVSANPHRHVSDIALAAAETMRHNDLHFGDMEIVDHWGQTPSGEVVLLDYGLDMGVYNQHYRPSIKPRIEDDEEQRIPSMKIGKQPAPAKVDPEDVRLGTTMKAG